MALPGDLDSHTKKQTTAGTSVSGASATFTGSMDTHQLHELLAMAEVSKYDLKLVSGVLTLAPKTVSY